MNSSLRMDVNCEQRDPYFTLCGATPARTLEVLMEFSDLYAISLNKLKSSWKGLPEKPEESLISTLKALWFFAAGIPIAVTLACKSELPELTSRQIEDLLELIEVRNQGVPLAYITGRQEFMGVEFLSSPEAMIPRKETEILGAAAKQAVDQAIRERGSARVLDLCTGSGNLGLFLARNEPACQVTGIDLFADAINLARQNVDFLGLSDQVELIHGDLFQPFESTHRQRKFDVIVCNPPYYSSTQVKDLATEISNYEPEVAFDGGPFGLRIPWRLINEAPLYLARGAWVCFEVGVGQGMAILHSLQKNPAYQTVKTHLNKNGEIRAFSAQTALNLN